MRGALSRSRQRRKLVSSCFRSCALQTRMHGQKLSQVPLLTTELVLSISTLLFAHQQYKSILLFRLFVGVSWRNLDAHYSIAAEASNFPSSGP